MPTYMLVECCSQHVGRQPGLELGGRTEAVMAGVARVLHACKHAQGGVRGVSLLCIPLPPPLPFPPSPNPTPVALLTQSHHYPRPHPLPLPLPTPAPTSSVAERGTHFELSDEQLLQLLLCHPAFVQQLLGMLK